MKHLTGYLQSCIPAQLEVLCIRCRSESDPISDGPQSFKDVFGKFPNLKALAYIGDNDIGTPATDDTRRITVPIVNYAIAAPYASPRPDLIVDEWLYNTGVHVLSEQYERERRDWVMEETFRFEEISVPRE